MTTFYNLDDELTPDTDWDDPRHDGEAELLIHTLGIFCEDEALCKRCYCRPCDCSPIGNDDAEYPMHPDEANPSRRYEDPTIDAVVVLPKGSTQPAFVDRCRVVRAESYRAQRERNARFEHLRKLICKVETPAPAPFLTETSMPEVPHYTGPVVTLNDTPDAEYVKNESERVARESYRVRPARYADGFQSSYFTVSEPTDEHHHALVEAQMDADELAAEREAERPVWDTRAQAAITVNCKTGWVTYTSSQAKARVSVNCTTLKLTIKFGKTVIDTFKYENVEELLHAQEIHAAFFRNWLADNDHSDSVATSRTMLYPKAQAVAKARVWRDALSKVDVECKVEILRDGKRKPYYHEMMRDR